MAVIKRTRKRFFIISPRYTFPNAEPCICTETQMMDILQKERRAYRKVIEGPDCKEKENAHYYTMVGVAVIKTKKSDGSLETHDIVNRATYLNSRLPDKHFSPIYLIGHDIDKYLHKDDRDKELQSTIDALCRTNEINSDSVLILIKFLSITVWWRTQQGIEIRNNIKKRLTEYKRTCPAHESALISMVTQ